MLSGFNAIGHPVPPSRRSKGLEAVRQMWPGISTEKAMLLIDSVSNKLERDQPYEAMEIARQEGLDLTGTYRLVATLLT